MPTHTEDTKEMTVEKILKDIDFWKSQERNGHSFDEMNKAVEALKESVRTTLTLYASQVREEERKRIEDEFAKVAKYTQDHEEDGYGEVVNTSFYELYEGEWEYIIKPKSTN